MTQAIVAETQIIEQQDIRLPNFSNPSFLYVMKAETINKNVRQVKIIPKTDLKLNLGCGENILTGCINIDKISLPSVDLILDLEKTPLPFKENSVSEIRCSHILEHIVNFLPLMEELYRICKPHAIIYVSAPYFRYEGAYRDPTHVRFFTEHSFDYFQAGVKFSHYSQARFKVRKIYLRNHFISSIKNLHKKIIRFLPFKRLLNIFLWNIYSEINYELEVIK
ncbi:hypothetical protein FJZ19_04735 [Candidatus Pacearchaeota archaeon]|nr:hypothetical protein [Candidatus Pacearchaeota archaeon]